MSWKDRLTEESIEIKSKDQQQLALTKLYNILYQESKKRGTARDVDEEVKNIELVFHEGDHVDIYHERAVKNGVSDPSYLTPDRNPETNEIYGASFTFNYTKFTDYDLVDISLAPKKPSSTDVHRARRHLRKLGLDDGSF